MILHTQMFENHESRSDQKSYDVVVCGGGPAGIAAAVSAAQLGASVLLVELANCLGGNWTGGMMAYVLDGGRKGGMMAEIRKGLSEYGGYLRQSSGNSLAYDGRDDFTYDVEVMKVMLDEWCEAHQVDVRLQTRVVDVTVEASEIRGIVTESSSGREFFFARQFIDCTGNGDLGALAGCRYEMGHPTTGQVQPATLFAFVTGVPEGIGSTLDAMSKAKFKQALLEAGIVPSYQSPSLFKLPHPNLYGLMINHEYGVRCNDARGISQATMRARREIFQAVRRLSLLEQWRNVRLVLTASQIGIREGRRLRGCHKLTADDLQKGRRYPDAICRVEQPVDIHALDSRDKAGESRADIETKPYDIPFGCLVSLDLKNLGMAGRCISGDFYAHASYRVTGNAVPMGEAVGYAAAVAAQSGKSLHEIDGVHVSQEMRRRSV